MTVLIIAVVTIVIVTVVTVAIVTVVIVTSFRRRKKLDTLTTDEMFSVQLSPILAMFCQDMLT